MDQYGIIIGAALLVIVSACAWFLGTKAHAEVRRFRDEQHEHFRGRPDS